MKLKRATGSLGYVKSHPEIFLNYDGIQLHELATKIATDVITLGCCPAVIDRVGGWWVVMSPYNWMESDVDVVNQDIFSKLIPNPKAGQNASRNEIVLNAFASNIFVSKKGDINLVKGELEQAAVDDIKDKYSEHYLIAFS